jgi:hypothetical protein
MPRTTRNSQKSLPQWPNLLSDERKPRINHDSDPPISPYPLPSFVDHKATPLELSINEPPKNEPLENEYPKNDHPKNDHPKSDHLIVKIIGWVGWSLQGLFHVTTTFLKQLGPSLRFFTPSSVDPIPELNSLYRSFVCTAIISIFRYILYTHELIPVIYMPILNLIFWMVWVYTTAVLYNVIGRTMALLIMIVVIYVLLATGVEYVASVPSAIFQWVWSSVSSVWAILISGL